MCFISTMGYSKELRRKYVDWYIQPEDERMPRTRWCDQNGPDESTCIRWESQPWFQPMVDEAYANAALTPDADANIMKALVAKAESGDVKAIEVYRRVQAEIRGPRIEDKSSADWSDEDLLDLLEQEIEEVRARLAAAAEVSTASTQS